MGHRLLGRKKEAILSGRGRGKKVASESLCEQFVCQHVWLGLVIIIIWRMLLVSIYWFEIRF